ncbi:hypothetical protein [Cohaesibacter celericrescens]|uniref:hypothetical protein n=1 Tax=Cohaesibacter celericrescens TaxID=2067669 RepID=UPI003562C2DB
MIGKDLSRDRMTTRTFLTKGHYDLQLAAMDPNAKSVKHQSQQDGIESLMKALTLLRGPMLATTLISALAACSTQYAESPDRWINDMNNRAPTKSTIYICHAYSCKLKYSFHPTQKDLNALEKILANGSDTAKTERKAIGKAVQWFETRVGPLVGSDKDKGGLDLYSAGIPGQMDCIDEASNTTSLLMFAQQYGFLKHHRVVSPVARGFFLDGRYPHATAVVITKSTNKRFAVDSWKFDNGMFPAIKPLDVWMSESPTR